MVEATARSTGKHKAEQKVNNIADWVLGGGWLPGPAPGYKEIMEGCVPVCAWQK